MHASVGDYEVLASDCVLRGWVMVADMHETTPFMPPTLTPGHAERGGCIGRDRATHLPQGVALLPGVRADLPVRPIVHVHTYHSLTVPSTPPPPIRTDPRACRLPQGPIRPNHGETRSGADLLSVPISVGASIWGASVRGTAVKRGYGSADRDLVPGLGTDLLTAGLWRATSSFS